MMKQHIYQEDYVVTTMLSDFQKKLSLVGLLSMLQEAARVHAEKMGIGVDQMKQANKFWVMTKQKVIMKSWPMWQDKVHIVTWPREISGMSILRDFEIWMGEQKLGEAVTEFMVIDGETRRPIRPSHHPMFEKKGLQYLSFSPSNIAQWEQAELKRTVQVLNSDLDVNHHVNNTKYAQWILDTIPLELHKEFHLEEYEVNFRAETHLEDFIEISRHPLEMTEQRRNVTYQGLRTSDKKIVFTARLLASRQ